METNLTLVSARQSADLPAPPSPINNSIVHVYKGADYKYSIQMTVFIPAAHHKATFHLRYHRHDLGPAQHRCRDNGDTAAGAVTTLLRFTNSGGGPFTPQTTIDVYL